VDSIELVDFQIDAGRRIIAQLVNDGFDAKAVFWVKTAEEGWWFLYIATPIVEQKGLAHAYRTLQASMQKLQGIPLSLSDIKLIGADNPITKDIQAILDRYPGRMATRFGGKQLGGMTIEGAYIYPKSNDLAQGPPPMAKEDFFKELLKLMNRGPGILQPSSIILKDGNSFEGIPFSIQMGSHRTMVVQFIVNSEPVPRVVDVDDIASIL
jgi:hypothetical protein